MKLPLKETFKQVDDLVLYCLKEFPETRGSDKELIRRVWEIQGFRIPHKLIPFFLKVAHPETITRSRRKVQSEGRYLPDGLKVAERTLFAIEHRDFFRKEKHG